MMSDHFPLFTKEGTKATITLNRPEHKFLVITGAGIKTFSSGYTIDAILTRMDDSFQMLLNRIEQFNLTTICALNGSAYGGGVDLAICCDFRIISPHYT